MDKKVTITFDSFEDFKRFLENPPRIRLDQIATDNTTRYAEEPTKPPVVRVKSYEEAILGFVGRAVAPVTMSNLVQAAASSMGMRASKRNLHNIKWHVGQLAKKGKLSRVRRGVYTSAKKATKG